jgi:hypothetical protein
MSFLRRLFGQSGTGQSHDPDGLWIYVRCKRCGQYNATRVALRSELSVDYGQGGQASGYHARKVLVSGTNRCFHPVEVNLTFDSSKRLSDRQVSGGEFVTKEEYEAATSGAEENEVIENQE